MKPLQFRNKHWSWFRILDLVVFLSIVMNFGAFALTNALVIKESPEPSTFSEANPIAAKINGWQLAKGWFIGFLSFFFIPLFWTIMINFYLLYRNHIIKMRKLYYLTIIVSWYGLITAFDFFGNFGMLIGVMLYG